MPVDKAHQEKKPEIFFSRELLRQLVALFPYFSHLESIIDCVLQAGLAIISSRTRGISFSLKTDGTPVSQADLEADAILSRGLTDLFPHLPIISEEQILSWKKGGQQFLLIDPLDGTKAFLRGDRHYTVNVALIRDQTPAMGVIFSPDLGRLFIGCQGHHACEISQNQIRFLRVRKAGQAPLAAIISGVDEHPRVQKHLDLWGVEEVRYASSSLKFCLIAAGEVDVYPRFRPTMEWDTAAGQVILCAAGGCVHALDEGGYSAGVLLYGKKGYLNSHFIAGSEERFCHCSERFGGHCGT